MLAARWNCDFLDTGLMYRAVTLLGEHHQIPSDDVGRLGALADETDFAVNQHPNGSWRIFVNGDDLTDELHDDAVNRSVSEVSAIPEVREALVRQQRNIAQRGPIVMAGRDIGTVVLADAPLKIYLEASAATRAIRRANENQNGQGASDAYDKTLASLTHRDTIDSGREHSPLRPADDAHVITTDELDAEGVVDAILSIAEQTVGVSA